jgi:ubiquitin-like protein Pup
MAGQEQQRPQRRSESEDSEEVVVPTTATEAQTATDVDSLLDEIDDVLETNSEEFVRGFVQKGGQ